MNYNQRTWTFHKKNAEKIFKKAVKVLEEEMPAPSDECGFCKWTGVTNRI